MQPTRTTDHSESLIDNYFFILLIHIVKSIATSPNNRRDYYDFDVSALIDDIHSIDWEGELHTYADPDAMSDSFYIKLPEIVDMHLPPS